jgi:hypothetical protein
MQMVSSVSKLVLVRNNAKLTKWRKDNYEMLV